MEGCTREGEEGGLVVVILRGCVVLGLVLGHCVLSSQPIIGSLIGIILRNLVMKKQYDAPHRFEIHAYQLQDDSVHREASFSLLHHIGFVASFNRKSKRTSQHHQNPTFYYASCSIAGFSTP